VAGLGRRCTGQGFSLEKRVDRPYFLFRLPPRRAKRGAEADEKERIGYFVAFPSPGLKPWPVGPAIGPVYVADGAKRPLGA